MVVKKENPVNKSPLRYKLKKVNVEMNPNGTEIKIAKFGEMVFMTHLSSEFMDLYLCLHYGTL